jgi:hypothetical protein
MSNKETGGIFAGTDKVIDAFFDLRSDQRLRQKSLSRSLNDRAIGEEKFLSLVAELYDRIGSNYSTHAPSRASRPPSPENWRCKRVVALDDNNKSPEVLLERAVAMLNEAEAMSDWWNQVPVASGFVDHLRDKRAALDLLQLRDGTARFVELKWQSDTSAFAAFEVLRYGLIYLFCRANAARFIYADRPLMGVSRVDLQVIAPTAFYERHDLGWLERGLNHAVHHLSRQKTANQLAMGFAFLAIAPDFKLPFYDGKAVKAECATQPVSEAARRVCNLFDNLSPAWPDATVST